MKLLIDNLNEFYGENVRLVKTLMKRESPEEYYDLLKWALQMLYFDDEQWIEICRIDNYPHDRMNGCHIHQFGSTHVKREELTFQEADQIIKEVSARILREKFNYVVSFE